MMHMLNNGVVPFLPEEILTNILKRLPVKSLIRFQCVCKQWKNLIKLPSFIAEHLHHSGNQNPSLLFQRDYTENPLQLCVLDCSMQVREIHSGHSMGSWKVRIIGSSNGLVCVEFYNCGTASWCLMLWNPAIREARHLPRTARDCWNGHCLEFGFSPVVNDYKIVRTCARYQDVVNRVEVYSLSTGLWKEIDLGNVEGIRLLPKPVTVNGSMFWLGSKAVAGEEGERSISLIVSFDMAKEEFELMPMPDLEFGIQCDSNLGGDRTLMVYETKLAIVWNMLIGLEFDSFFVSLWVMEEGTGASGKTWSWTNKYTSRLFASFITPVTIWRDEIVSMIDCMGELFDNEDMCIPEDPTLVLFNINTGKFKGLAIDCHSHVDVRYISNFVESLMPVGNVHIGEP